MAGLFDWQDPNAAASMAMAAGLLSAGGPSLRPVSLGQALGHGLLSGQAAYRASEDQQFERQLMAQRQKMLEDQAAQQKLARDAAAQRQSFLLNLPQMMNLPRAGGPTVQNAQVQGQLTPEIAARAAAMGVDTKTLAEIAGARNIGRPEVKHWSDVRNPDGSVTVTGFDVYGDAKNTGATPFKAPEFRDLGGSVVGIDPITGKPTTSFAKTQSPDSAASTSLGWANLNFNKAKADSEKMRYDSDRGVMVNERTGQAQPVVMGGAPMQPKAIAEANFKTGQGATKALAVIDEAEKLLSKATGSYAGAARDQAARVVGASTQGAQATAQLQALEGALMLSQPRMEGPQSNLDVALYRQMAGQIGDPTVPNEIKRSALTTIRSLHEKYAAGAGSAPSAPAAGGFRYLGKE